MFYFKGGRDYASSNYQYHYEPQHPLYRQQQYQQQQAYPAASQPPQSKSSNYLDYYNSISTTVKPQSHYLYHNLTGYPQHGVAPNPQPNEVNVDYYDYNYNYEYETEPPPVKKDVVISPHPFVVAVRRWFNGLENRQFDLGFLGGNTIVSLIFLAPFENGKASSVNEKKTCF